MFAVIIGITLCVVVWAARQTKTTSDFYAAGGGITGTQNGWAIAGDYMSAASFLGISGMISLYGYDGFMYSVGWLVAYITVLLIVAEPCRNAGKYTLGDILSFRTDPKPVRAVAAISTVAVSTFYLTAQMVGAGKLMALLVGVPYKTAIIGVGILMVGYVVFGGMTATTWVQIIKAGLLMSGTVLLAFLVMFKTGLNPIKFFSDIVNNPLIQDHVRMNVLKDVIPKPGFDYGQRFMEPGLFLKNPLDQISLGIAWALVSMALEFGALDFTASEFWWVNAIILSAGLSYLALVFYAAVAQVTFASDNRSTRLRIIMLAQFMLLAGWVGWGWFGTENSDAELLLVFAILHALTNWLPKILESGGFSPSLLRKSLKRDSRFPARCLMMTERLLASGPICGVTPFGMRPDAKFRYSSTRERAQ